jgi:exopolyphosphatase/guanosine-5'-triphosphate,3'-diphosphate pyrophosphatase
MKGFLNLSKAFEVKVMKACATSAMRDASNTADVISLVKEKTGIEIEVISGTEEASLVFENHIAENLDKDYSYLYIDVGGGSTDVTFFSNNAIIFKESFNIGTIRVLKNQVTNEMWNEMKSVIKSRTKGFKTVTAIGSGGNINKVFSLSKRKDGKPLTLNLIRNYYKVMNNISLEERTNMYKLAEDRADVIVPALKIYLRAMRWAGAEKIYVPKIGLADGLVQHLWEESQGMRKENK